jgi:pyruvate,water dikinase
MVAPESAGLLFTRHPVTGAKQFVIEATSGLGDALAAGTVTPERWTVEDETAAPEAGVDSAVLTADSALNLAVLGQQIESVFLAPQDVEWAVADGRTWILQARPITAADALQRPNEMNPASGNVLAAGVPASPGVALGEVTVITSLDDFDAFDAGDVLVCHSTSPAWTPLLARAAAVVTETGGLLAHAAIVAREFGIPAVVAAEGAMKLLAGTTRSVVVDGGRGIVTAHTTGAHQ